MTCNTTYIPNTNFDD